MRVKSSAGKDSTRGTASTVGIEKRFEPPGLLHSTMRTAIAETTMQSRSNR